MLRNRFYLGKFERSLKPLNAVISKTVCTPKPKQTSNSIRYLSDSPEKLFTKLSDENDSQRDAFFKYSWGTWIKNDEIEKAKRTTRFSIEGLNDILNDVYSQSKSLAQNSKNDEIPKPSYNMNLTVTLPHNLTTEAIGTVNPNEKVKITCMSSIHEGKHHRVYKVDTNLDRSFVLRIPYSLEDENTIANRVKSEVATMDFVALKLGINVPKTYVFGVNNLNPLRQPFVLQEFIDGQLLMRDWAPLSKDTADGNPDDKLKKVVDQLSEFQSKLLAETFNGSGSIYFEDDLKKETKKLPLYETEPDVRFQNRWALGASAERCIWRKKDLLSFETKKKFAGPNDLKAPLEIVKQLGELELANAKARLEKLNTEIDEPTKKLVQNQVKTFENLVTLAPSLINPDTKSIPNIQDLLKPRLFHPDLDPMNVIINKNNEPYLLDFEGTSTKALILQNSPQFVAYDGPKIFNLKEDIENFDNLSEQEKAQYEFMYKRTRNQHLWESAFNKRQPSLISCLAPPVKLLRNPYISTIELKQDQEYLLIDESLIQLKAIWDVFVKNKLVQNVKFPIEITNEMLESHTKELNEFHKTLISRPFAATQGWIPQDMFDNLLKAGILYKNENGDYDIKPQQ